MKANFSIPADEDYTAVLGRAVYNFAYYEWIVVWTLEKLNPGYLSNYSINGFTSGIVAREWENLLKIRPLLQPEMQTKLEDCAATFNNLFRERNKLVHAHPYTAEGNIQQLGYNSRSTNIKWPMQDVEALAKRFDLAAGELNVLFYQIWPSP